MNFILKKKMSHKMMKIFNGVLNYNIKIPISLINI